MTLGWPELTELDAYRITEIPRRPDAGDTEAPRDQSSDPGRTQRLAALIAAYHVGAHAKSSGRPAGVAGLVPGCFDVARVGPPRYLGDAIRRELGQPGPA